MARCGELHRPKTQSLSLISMSSSAVEKAAVLECLRHVSMTDVLVLDLEMMPQSHGLEFMSDIAVPIVDTSDLVESAVAYADFKKVMYECFQASLDVPSGGRKVIIRSSKIGKYSDFITRYEKEFLNMIAVDVMDDDEKLPVLHVENFSFYNRPSSDFGRVLQEALRWQNRAATVDELPIASSIFSDATDSDESIGVLLFTLKKELVDSARAVVEPRSSEPTQLGVRMQKPNIDPEGRIESRHEDVVRWLQPRAPPTVAPTGASLAVRSEVAPKRSKSPVARWLGAELGSVLEITAFAQNPQPQREPRSPSTSRPSVRPPFVAAQRYIANAQQRSLPEPMTSSAAPVPNPQDPHVQADIATPYRPSIIETDLNVDTASDDQRRPVMRGRGTMLCSR